MREQIEYIVVGAGVVGLAIARELALQKREVLILEKADRIGTGVSSRNSEVIHAGIYYPERSLKARLCVSGRSQLYNYLKERKIEYQRCGKLIVANNHKEENILEDIYQSSKKNGVDDIQKLNSKNARIIEPELKCKSALFSPSTGIFDSHSYMLNLHGDAENNGAVFAFKTAVVGGFILQDSIQINVQTEKNEMSLLCKTLINCAGLGAQKLASSIQGFPNELVPSQFLAKGNYFSLKGKAPFSHLIYPVPSRASLGTHFTRDLGGQGRFGPDLQWIDEINYDVDPGRAKKFFSAIKRYWPNIEEKSLCASYSGIRPKIHSKHEKIADFLIQDSSTHGFNSIINLFGIESPGLTSSLAIAREIAKKL